MRKRHFNFICRENVFKRNKGRSGLYIYGNICSLALNQFSKKKKKFTKLKIIKSVLCFWRPGFNLLGNLANKIRKEIKGETFLLIKREKKLLN